MKKFKQAKTSEGKDRVDLISNLPDHILQLILSRIPTTEEVNRTSILSRRWRYLWTLVPSIDIDYTRGMDPFDIMDSNAFREFVYWVLLNKHLDFDNFRLSCPSYINMSTIRQWIHAAVMRKVKRLDLTFRPSRGFEHDIEVPHCLPHCLVTCGSLEVLRLHLLGRSICLPNIKGFSALRVLELNDIELKERYLVKYFLEGCPLLEDLSLIDCHDRARAYAYDLVISSPKLKNLRIETRQFVSDEVAYDDDNDDLCLFSTLEISCPKLVFLKLKGFVALRFLFENLFSLKEAVLHPKDLCEWEAPTFDFFARISNVEFLSISLYCIGACFGPRVDVPISLPNLKTLKLTVDDNNMGVLIQFLKCLPDLESLHLIFPKDIYGVHKWNLDEAATISILTCHLKKVEFLEFDEEKPKLAVARALLKHGNELEEMVFSWSNEARFHQRSKKTMKEVSKFHKASSVELRRVIKPVQANS